MKNFFKYQLPEKLSTRVLYVIAAVTMVIFLLFWLVGYDRPYEDDPNFTAPLFTNALLLLMYIVLVAAVVVVAWSMARGFKTSGGRQTRFNNIPTRRISLCVSAGTIVLMLLTFALGSSQPMRINGANYTDAFWLKVSDMFIFTSGLLIVAAIVAVAYGATKYSRKS